MTIQTEVAAVLAEMRGGHRSWIKLNDWANRLESALASSAEPVAFQSRFKSEGHPWREITKEGFDSPCLPEFERRALYAHAPPAVPVASVPDGFYLASFNHKDRGGGVLWWVPNDAGYTTDIEQAGIYAEITPGYHDSAHTVPVPVAFVNGCRIRRTIDPGDSKNRAFWSAADLRAALATNQEGATP